MATSLGLDNTIKATESNTAKLVRLRAIFQLLDLWLEWKDVENPVRAVELAHHLRMLVGLASAKHAARDLKDWLPDRLLAYVEHEIDSIGAQLERHAIDTKLATRMRGYLEEVRFNSQIVRLIYQLERQADPNRANLQLSRDQVTQTLELTAGNPAAPRIYARLFGKCIKLTTRAGEIWRDVQKEQKSFLTGADPRQVS